MDQARNDRCNSGSFSKIASRTLTAYVRMSATVVIAVVVRMCLDCIGIILTGQDPTALTFWFSHCSGERQGACVAMGISIFVASLLGCSAFAWGVQDWIKDPLRNPRARYHSFDVVLEAATWVPISVVVGKTNALVDWLMDVTENDLIQALVGSLVAAVITGICTLLTHVAMKHCRSVADQSSKAGMAGFAKFVLLATLYCLGWAVGWSNWKLVLSMMDALEPGTSVHNTVLAGAVISAFLVVAVCFYLRFGPEPIIPDPELQQICYHHGFSGSIRRSLISYAVYSCTVFMVLALSDSTYGFIHVLRKKFYTLGGQTDTAAAMHEKILIASALGMMACLVTALSVLTSATITKTTEVDQSSSMRLSRSVCDARKLMITSQLMVAPSELLTMRNSRGIEEDVALDEMIASAPSDDLVCEDIGGSSPSVTGRSSAGGGDDAAGCPRGATIKYDVVAKDMERQVSEPTCDYSPLDLDEFGSSSSSGSGRGSHHISRTVCGAVLVYDVLGLVVCYQWGTFAFRLYGMLFGPIAGIHNALYFSTVVCYAAATIYLLTRFVWRYFPSPEELKWHRGRRGGDPSWWLMAEAKEPFLDDEDDDGLEEAAFFDRAPPNLPSGVSWPPLTHAASSPALTWQPLTPVRGTLDVDGEIPHGAI